MMAISIILFLAAFVWYLNVDGIYHAVKRFVAKRAAREPEQAAKTAHESNRTGE